MNHVIEMRPNEIGLLAGLMAAHVMALAMTAALAWQCALLDEQAKVRARLARMRQMLESRPTRHIIAMDEDGRQVDLYEFDNDGTII